MVRYLGIGARRRHFGVVVRKLEEMIDTIDRRRLPSAFALQVSTSMHMDVQLVVPLLRAFCDGVVLDDVTERFDTIL